MLTTPQYCLVNLLARRGPLDVYSAAKLLNSTLSAISRMRTALIRVGYIHDYEKYDDPMRITVDGAQAYHIYETE